MKKYNLKGSLLHDITFLGFILFSTMCLGQTYVDESSNNQELVENNELSRTNFLSSFGVDASSRNVDPAQNGNAVFLTQIGELNRIRVGIQAEASEINLSQHGDRNFTQLNYNVNTAFADIVQNGNNNRVLDFVNSPASNIALELQQNGNNLNFQRQGVNGLTESLRFIQTEASPSLIIRSNR